MEMVEAIVTFWNKEREQYLAQNQILPFATLSVPDIDLKYKSILVLKLEKIQELAIRQLMNDLPRVLEVY
jgi:hypothetical protein